MCPGDTEAGIMVTPVWGVGKVLTTLPLWPSVWVRWSSADLSLASLL